LHAATYEASIGGVFGDHWTQKPPAEGGGPMANGSRLKGAGAASDTLPGPHGKALKKQWKRFSRREQVVA